MNRPERQPMKMLSFQVEPELFDLIERSRGTMSRSRWVAKQCWESMPVRMIMMTEGIDRPERYGPGRPPVRKRDG